MSEQQTGSYHTVGEEWLTSYVAGGLSPAKRLAIACQSSVQPEIRQHLDDLEHVGGALLESAEGEELSEGFMTRVFAALDHPPADAAAPPDAGHDEIAGKPDWMPRPLSRFMKASNIDIRWRRAGGGVDYAPLWQDANGERLYLLRAKPGVEIPAHTHRGQEWTLILQGGYHVGETGYVEGDMHQEDETCLHEPVVDKDGECIALVAIEGKLEFKDLLPRLAQKLSDI